MNAQVTLSNQNDGSVTEERITQIVAAIWKDPCNLEDSVWSNFWISVTRLKGDLFEPGSNRIQLGKAGDMAPAEQIGAFLQQNTGTTITSDDVLQVIESIDKNGINLPIKIQDAVIYTAAYAQQARVRKRGTTTTAIDIN